MSPKRRPGTPRCARLRRWSSAFYLLTVALVRSRVATPRASPPPRYCSAPTLRVGGDGGGQSCMPLVLKSCAEVDDTRNLISVRAISAGSPLKWRMTPFDYCNEADCTAA